MDKQNSPTGTQQLLIQESRELPVQFETAIAQDEIDCAKCRFHEARHFDQNLGNLCLKCFIMVCPNE